MIDREREDSRDLWNRVADDWRMQVGDDGDGNRRLNSDPVCGHSPAMSTVSGCSTPAAAPGIYQRNSVTVALWSWVLTSPTA
jgi:hypothetical protein